MKSLACLVIALAFSTALNAQVAAPSDSLPTLARTFVLPGLRGTRPNVGVPGRIDHGAYDPATDRLFIAALENSSLEVLDLKTGTRAASITNLSHPQGIAVSGPLGCAVVACGGDGTIHVFDTKTLKETKSMPVGEDADNVRHNASNNTFLVCYGDTNRGAIAVIDPTGWTVARTLEFPSKPESFQLDLAGQRLFANLPRSVRATNDGQVAAVDLRSGKTLAMISLDGVSRNFPMAFDAAHQRLFVAARRPARLIEIDTRSYKVAQQIACGEDSDDLFYDARRNQAIVIEGGYRPDLSATNAAFTDENGSISVFSPGPSGALALIGQVATAQHARTGFFAAPRNALYVFVPFRGEREAEIREYLVP